MALFPSKRQPQKLPAAAPKTVSLDVVHLPEPDAWGNYWLSLGSDRTQGPCILHHSIPKDQASKAVSSEDVKWFVSWGGEKGILFDGPKIRYFPNPEAALKAIQGNR